MSSKQVNVRISAVTMRIYPDCVVINNAYLKARCHALFIARDACTRQLFVLTPEELLVVLSPGSRCAYGPNLGCLAGLRDLRLTSVSDWMPDVASVRLARRGLRSDVL